MEVPLCRNCGAAAEEGYAVPFCTSCRDQVVQYPIPRWLRAAMVVIALMLVYALARFPATLKGARAYEHGQTEEQNGDFVAAERDYQTVADVFPTSSAVQVRLAVVSHRAGDNQRAVKMIRHLSGLNLPSASAAELDFLMHEMDYTDFYGSPSRDRPGDLSATP